MSEDVKPRKIAIEKTELNDWKPELDAGEMHPLYCYNPDSCNYPNGLTFIELEPTMRLMDEMYDVINSIDICYGDAMYGHGLTEALKKYKKFKDGLR